MKKILVGVVIGVAALLVVMFVLGALFLGSIIKKGVETVGPTLTKTEVKLDSANVGILSGSGSLKGFVLGNPAGYQGAFAIKIGKVDLGVQPKSVLSDKVHITHLRLDSPEIRIEGGPKDNNLTKILENVQAASGGSGGDKKPPAGDSQGASKKLQIDELTVTGGKVYLATALTGGREVALTLPDIRFTNLGEGPDGVTAADLTKKLLDEVTKSAIAAMTKGLADLGKGAVDAASAAAKDAAQDPSKAVKSIGDLFKKK